MKFPLSKIVFCLFFNCLFLNSSYGATVGFKQIRCTAGVNSLNKSKSIPSSKEIGEWEERVVELVNQIRRKQGLPSLKINTVLASLAQTHSMNMARGVVEFGHAGFNQRSLAIFKLKKHNSVGENVAYNYRYTDPVQVAVDGWMKSPGHKENILGNYDETGVGIVFSKEGRCYLTQLFARTIKK